MAAMQRMQMQSFLTKLVVLLLVDGYMNFIIFSYLSPASPFMNKDDDDMVVTPPSATEE